MFGSMWDAVSDRDYSGWAEPDEDPALLEESPIEQPADMPEGDAAENESCPF